jgi:hypothetical protein
VYVDAFIPDQGDAIGGLASGSCLGSDSFNPVPYPGGPPGDVDLYLKPSLADMRSRDAERAGLAGSEYSM